MKLLTNAAGVHREVYRLIRECSSCQIAVAWASVGFSAFDQLAKNHSKIEKMVVGTHFYQTHPDFIERFHTHANVRFVMSTDGVFHPKVYLFEMDDGSWECLIGSPNFTNGGFSQNDELAVLINDEDEGAGEALVNLKAAINGFWLKASSLTVVELESYRDAWKRKQPDVKKLLGKFGNPSEERAGDHGKTPLDVPILRMTWADYFEKVKSESDHPPNDHSMEGRLAVIRATTQLFADHPRFKDLDLTDRQKIAGLVMKDGVNFLWFGSMKGAGYFKQAINRNNEDLSVALDVIPLTGDVSRNAYLGFVERFTKAFPNGGDGIGTATRLLTMKRPDVFVCFDARNKNELCLAFGISRNLGYEAYWDSIIERIKDSTWWNAHAPLAGVELEVWQARSAFLDALFYDGKDMPAAS